MAGFLIGISISCCLGYGRCMRMIYPRTFENKRHELLDDPPVCWPPFWRHIAAQRHRLVQIVRGSAASGGAPAAKRQLAGRRCASAVDAALGISLALTSSAPGFGWSAVVLTAADIDVVIGFRDLLPPIWPRGCPSSTSEAGRGSRWLTPG